MPNILYLSNVDPRDVTFGNAQRTHFLWESLKQLGTVFAICPKLVDNQKQVHDSSNNIHIVAYSPSQASTPPLCRKGIVERLLYFLSKRTGIHWNRHPAPLPLESLFPDTAIDYVVCRYVHTAVAYHPWNIAPTYIDIDDHPLQVFDTRLRHQFSTLRGFFYRLCLKIYLSRVFSHLSGAWVSNQGDLSRLPFLRKKGFLPNIPAISREPGGDQRRCQALLTIGCFSYAPNREGINDFLTNVWPAVHEQFPQLEYWLIGQGGDLDWGKMANVKYIGFVDKLDQYYCQCLATVAPINCGGGTCIKVLESLAMSRVCLATPFGARGLRPGTNSAPKGLLVYQCAQQFLDLLRENVFNSSTRSTLEQQAHVFLVNNYSFSSFAEAVKQILPKS